MNEASKAMRRRFVEHHSGGFQWLELFRGARGIDVGCGDDMIPFTNCEPFDQAQGDANNLREYFADNTFAYLHASQCLEHMTDPKAALDSWISVVRPRGYLIISVPDFILYEGGRWPSIWNPDHKSTWSMTLKGSLAGDRHVFVPEFLRHVDASVVRCEHVDTNYDYSKLLSTEDQTFSESRGVEAFIEFVLRKKIHDK